ncbi:hypothetical protein HMPREF9078_01685 [Capnocytophaga sp. oral taxon 380 str. F0488]|nr:hypothetical protein HMPREF9078_01685 [Capnocytophaga sp. oral taxon 380 str. F0488]
MSYADRYRKDKGNLLLTHTQLSLYTYPAIAGYLQRGNCSDAKTKNGRRMDEKWTKNGRRKSEAKLKVR